MPTRDRALAEGMRGHAALRSGTVQRWLAKRLGDRPRFGGERFGRADAAVAPVLNRSVHYGLAPRAGSAPARRRARLARRPAFAVTFAEFRAAAERMRRLPDL